MVDQVSYHGDPGLPAGSPPSGRENEEFERQTECEVCGASDPQWCDAKKHGAAVIAELEKYD